MAFDQDTANVNSSLAINFAAQEFCRCLRTCHLLLVKVVERHQISGDFQNLQMDSAIIEIRISTEVIVIIVRMIVAVVVARTNVAMMAARTIAATTRIATARIIRVRVRIVIVGNAIIKVVKDVFRIDSIVRITA